MKADMTASRDSVELLLYLIYYGLSQGLRLEDGTYSSTLLAYINRPLWNWRDKAKKESYTYLGQNQRHLHEQKHVPLKACRSNDCGNWHRAGHIGGCCR